MNKFISNKYTTILEAKDGQLEELVNISKNDPWKPIFHIHPECGLLNDPNGLSYFNGEYHVFYQWFPFGPIHGMKHWAHVKSKDLVHWERMSVAIIPTENYESHGAYSGNAIVKDDQLLLFYTGNVKYSDIERDANQCLAIMNKDYTVQKSTNNPVIKGVPKGYTGHVRDPKVWKDGDKYYMLLGAQRENLTGSIIVYESPDAIEWSFKGELKTSLEKFGFMWECPDYIKLNGKDILIFSPQGIEASGHDYKNLYNVIYAAGKLDLGKLTFDIEYIKELDKGFDFYAPQTFEDDSNRRLMFGWCGMPEVEYPSDKNMWAHCLTLPRELSFEDNILKQKPAEELKDLRKDHLNIIGNLDNNLVDIKNNKTSYELDIDFTNINSDDIILKLLKSENEEFIIHFDVVNKAVFINRENFIDKFAEEFGHIRSGEINIGENLNLKIFVDRSIVEIFINDGELVFTSRVFPLETSTGIEISSRGTLNYNIDKYTLERGI